VIEERKVKATSTLIVDLLKKFDIPGSQAVRMFQAYGPEYSKERITLTRPHIFTDLSKVKK